MTTTLLTGLPRSGTTLLCAMLNALPDTVALAEPMPRPSSDVPESIIAEIAAFATAIRVRAIGEGKVPTKALDGRVPDNFLEAPNPERRLRNTVSKLEDVSVGKALTPNFHLYIKHPALFAALVPHLRGRFPLFALIRDPLTVLAGWQTVNLPVHFGHLPAAERVDAELRSRLGSIQSRIDRQVAIMVWFLRTFASLSPRNIVRYEDIVLNPDAVVASLHVLPAPPIRHPIFRESAEKRYAGIDMPLLARHLQSIVPEIEYFYPGYREILGDVRRGKPSRSSHIGLNGRGKTRVDFFVAGVQKGGTTALAQMLTRHPSIRLANRKEVHFFDDAERSWEDPDYEYYHCWFRPPGAHTKVWGEATPIYFFQADAVARIHRYNPKSKFIICLRHPTFRAHSQWRMETVRGNEDWDFSRAISAEGRSRIQSGDRNARTYSYVERGLYARQFRHLFNLFPRAQVHVLRTDHLWRDSGACLAGICSFLDVTPMAHEGPSVYQVPHDSRELGRMSLADRQYLDALFRQEIEETQTLTGIDLSDWLDPDYEEPMPPPREA